MLWFTSNADQVRARFEAGVLRQLPFATAQALTDAAWEAQRAVTAQLEVDLDRPTPFTKRAFAVERATKTWLEAKVQARPIQASYLALQARGGRRWPKKKAIVLPKKVGLDPYGNIPKGAVRQLLARKDVFATRRGDPRVQHLRPGIYLRGRKKHRAAAAIGQAVEGTGNQLRLLIAFEEGARYRPVYRFDEAARKAAKQAFGPALARRLEQALATAR